MVEAIAMNLAHAILMPPESGYLAVLLGKPKRPKSRYDHPAFGDTFATIINAFAGIGWLILRPSPGMGEASAIAPTIAFRAKVEAAGIGLTDFHHGVGETVILSRKAWRPGEAEAARALIDYPETTQSTALRSDMESLNAFLTRADLAFVDDGLGSVDIQKRHQRRHFSSRSPHEPVEFRYGGRMFGGWWQYLPRGRRDHIRIDGEPVATLDFSSMFVRLLYAKMGIQAPERDLYAFPGFEDHRRAAKLITNCLLFDERRRNRWPKVEEPSHAMPAGLTMPRVRAIVSDHLPEITPFFGSGIGHELMNTESVIMMEVLKEMTRSEIPGLGLHDGLLTPASQSEKVRRIMEDVSRQITSTTIPVTTLPPRSSLVL